MKKTVLSTALLTILSTSAFTDNSVQPATLSNTTSVSPTQTIPSTEIKPATPTAPQTAPIINCKYRIPADTVKIEQSVLTIWAEKTAVQSFEFNPTTIDNELNELKFCYTDPGWQSFNDALQKSGNIDAIKSQHLTVSSQVDGEVKINMTKDNQWKAIVPLQVVYQNNQEKLTQLLTIELLIGRKISGDLGVMQMIATPRQTSTPQQPEVSTATAATTSEQTTTPTPANTEKPTFGNNQPVGTQPH